MTVKRSLHIKKLGESAETSGDCRVKNVFVRSIESHVDNSLSGHVWNLYIFLQSPGSLFLSGGPSKVQCALSVDASLRRDRED